MAPNNPTPPQPPSNPTPPPVASTTLSPEQFQQLMAVIAAGNTGNAQQMAELVSNAVIAAVSEMRKPTPEEAAKQEKERQRILNARKQAAHAGELAQQQITAQQAGCPHQKPNGRHTFGGQIHSDGWAVVRCQRCLREWRVIPLPQHVQNGNVLDLSEIQGLTVSHLDNWVKQSPAMAERIAAAQAALASVNKVTQEQAAEIGI